MKLTKIATRAAGVLVALSIVAATAGCAPEATEGEVESLVVWGYTPLDSVKAAFDSYEAETGVAIEYVAIPDPFEDTLLTKWATGERPDVMMGQPFPSFMEKLQYATTLQDLSDAPFVEAQKYDIGQVGAMEGGIYSAVFGFPTMFGLYYNKAVFEDAGLTAPTSPEEFSEVTEALKAAGVAPVAVSGGDTWTLQLPVFVDMTDAVVDGFITDINDRSASFSDPGFVDALDGLQDLVDGGLTNADFATATYADTTARFEAGEIAMVIQGSWMIDALTGDISNYGFIPFPSESGKVLAQSGNATTLQLPITGNEAREAAARDLLDYMTVGEGYSVYVNAQKEPSIVDGVDDPAEVSALTLEAGALLENSVPSPDSAFVVSRGDLPGLLSQLVSGLITSEELAKTVQATYVDNAQLAGIPGW